MNKQLKLLLKDYLKDNSAQRLLILIKSINPIFDLNKSNKESVKTLLNDFGAENDSKLKKIRLNNLIKFIQDEGRGGTTPKKSILPHQDTISDYTVKFNQNGPYIEQDIIYDEAVKIFGNLDDQNSLGSQIFSNKLVKFNVCSYKTPNVLFERYCSKNNKPSYELDFYPKGPGVRGTVYECGIRGRATISRETKEII
jgi:hypothetical protein